MILTPHIGGSTMEAQANIAEEVAEKMIRLVKNGSTTTNVNLPEVELRNPPDSVHRLLHLHANVPGVLSNINSVVSDLQPRILLFPFFSFLTTSRSRQRTTKMTDPLGSVAKAAAHKDAEAQNGARPYPCC